MGISIGHIYRGVLAYADDIALTASSPDLLQSMLDICVTVCITVLYGSTLLMLQSQPSWFVGNLIN